MLLVALAVTGVLFAATFRAWQDYRDSAPSAVTPAASRIPASPQTTSVASAAFRTPETTRPDPLVLTAARGESWVAVRAGSESGALLYQGTLAEGDRLSYRRNRLWINLGLPTNVDATLAGEELPLPTGVATVLLRDGRLTTVEG